MKSIKIEQTHILESRVKYKGSPVNELCYLRLIEMALDVVPQGGFTPVNIRERARIQEAINMSDGEVLNLEDSDFEVLVTIMANSRWTIRDTELDTLLQNFKTGVYLNPKQGN